jgi:hypothetical protein
MNLGEHTKAAIRNGGQLMLKQTMREKYIFHAHVTFSDGSGSIGNISTTEEGALENLELKLKFESEN